jgi:hypothetical protein
VYRPAAKCSPPFSFQSLGVRGAGASRAASPFFRFAAGGSGRRGREQTGQDQTVSEMSA